MAVISEAARPKLRIGGERFFIEEAAGVFYIRHDRWSLLGSGDSVFAAYKDLLAEARDLAHVLSSLPRGGFDLDALELYRFVLRLA